VFGVRCRRVGFRQVSSDNQKSPLFDVQKMVKSKRAYRRDLAGRPMAEKLRMLDALRERTIAIRKAAKDYRKTLGKLA
jgi:hypothetical protein